MMDSLRTFMDEMLDDQGRKEGFISDLLANLKTQPIPTLEQAQTGYTTVSNLHGIFYNYDASEVTISYKVVPDMYAPYTMSFRQFEVVLEGLLTSRRNQKWQINISHHSRIKKKILYLLFLQYRKNVSE